MKNYTFLLFILISLSIHAQEKETLEGDLYFGVFRVGSLYDQTKESITIINAIMDTIDEKNATTEDKEFIEEYKLIKKKGFLYQPYVQLLIEEDSIIYIYLKQSDYNKIKIFKRKELITEREKIVIRIKYKRLIQNRLVCRKILRISKIDGETKSIETKFEVLDYE